MNHVCYTNLKLVKDNSLRQIVEGSLLRSSVRVAFTLSIDIIILSSHFHLLPKARED